MLAKKILIVEDDRMLLRALEQSLKNYGYDVFIATNGREALEKFSGIGMDLVVCDLMMPEVSGISFIKTLKEKYQAAVPVIVISSVKAGEQITNSLDYKNSVFIPKPFSFEKISDIVKCLLD